MSLIGRDSLCNLLIVMMEEEGKGPPKIWMTWNGYVLKECTEPRYRIASCSLLMELNPVRTRHKLLTMAPFRDGPIQARG